MCMSVLANVTFWFFMSLYLNLLICKNKNEYTHKHVQILLSYICYTFSLVLRVPAVPGSGWTGYDNQKPLFKHGRGVGVELPRQGAFGETQASPSYPLPLLTWACQREKRLAMKRKGNLPREQDPPAFGALGNKESDSSPNLKGEWVGGTNK